MKTQYNLTFTNPKEIHVEEFKTKDRAWCAKYLCSLTGNLVTREHALFFVDRMLDDPLDTFQIEGLPLDDGMLQRTVANFADRGITVIKVLTGPLGLVKQAAFEALELGDHKLSRDLVAILVEHEGK